MQTIYFILDITHHEPKISGSPFIQIKNDNNSNLYLQMIRDISFSGILEKNKKIHFLIISTEVIKKSDYLIVANKFLKKYAENPYESFSELFRLEQEIFYTIDPNNAIQTYSNARVKLSLDEIEKDNQVLWYYSNPNICIYN